MELGEFSHNDHCSLFAVGAAGEVQAGKLKHEVTGGLVGDLWQSGIESQKFSTSREGLFLGSVGEKPRVGAG